MDKLPKILDCIKDHWDAHQPNWDGPPPAPTVGEGMVAEYTRPVGYDFLPDSVATKDKHATQVEPEAPLPENPTVCEAEVKYEHLLRVLN